MTEAKNSVAKWLEIAAHVGIVVGLLLVAFQIAQEDDIAETELRGHLFSNVTAYYEQFTGENPAISLARAIDDPRTLTTEDHVVLFNVYMAEFAKAMRQETISEYKIGRSAVVRWTGLLNNPYGYAWWKVFGKPLSPFVPQLYAALEPELERLGPEHADQTAIQIQAVQDILLELEK
jgi:hypothetical protein